ncbi:hypothetical protein PSDVSF_24470 [Pseudodesulfovibrio sediminis]|uniref:Uncharacterized protein n=1 Tax=Pseudodesulfovibrio sediminis TaxID=2810563 RepID=A0ABN6EUQ9_9BACT|nr:hypothetical protein PSDVSF_24470 [Pseudodesulfovibrio sediminis]
MGFKIERKRCLEYAIGDRCIEPFKSMGCCRQQGGNAVLILFKYGLADTVLFPVKSLLGKRLHIFDYMKFPELAGMVAWLYTRCNECVWCIFQQ